MSSVFSLDCAKLMTQIQIRSAELMDGDAVWSILEPVIRAGETYSLPVDLSRLDGLSYWFSDEHEVFVAEDDTAILGTYYLKANNTGGGAHVANCGFVTADWATGKGVAQTMLDHALSGAKERGFKAMQFNFVIGSNERAVKLLQRNGFEIVGTLPEAYLHPKLGYVDAHVMYKKI